MNWLQKISKYTDELGYLNRYLRQGFDPYDYTYHVVDYLRSTGVDIGEDVDSYDFGEAWLERASDADKEAFKEYLEGNEGSRHMVDAYDQPAYETLDYLQLVKPTWLLHFTDDASSVASEGFLHGHEEMDRGLHLTTHKYDRKKYPGYNFAVKPNSGVTQTIARSGKYGDEAVLFWSAGVEAYHYGDEEHQVIFWGPSVDPKMIFPITKEYGKWQVLSEQDDRILKESEDISDIADWIETNWRMLTRIREKEFRRGNWTNTPTVGRYR